MKLKYIFLCALSGAALVACDNSAEKPLSNISDTTQADSLVYYLGEIRGAEYLRESLNDSTLSTPEARHAYLEGVKAGIKAVKDNESNFNRGVFLGVQSAINMAQFKEDYGYELSERVFLEGLAHALDNDSVYDPSDSQREFYRIMGEFSRNKEARDREAASTALQTEAKKLNMTQLSENLWAGNRPTDNQKIQAGDRISLNLKVTNMSGREIKLPLPPEMTVGQRMKDSPLSEAIMSLSSGETGNFLTTAYSLLGARTSQMKLQPADVLHLEITPVILND